MSQDSDIRGLTITSLGWTGSSQLLQTLAQFLFTAVLAHLVSPEDFGLVALVVVFSGFAVVFVDFGLSAALIQRPNLEERHLSTAFWLHLAGGVVFTLGMAALAPALAAFYDQPEVVELTLALSPAFVLISLGIVQLAILQREMDFRRIAYLEIAALLLANALAIALALAGAGVWSLVALGLATVGLRSVFAWAISPWRPQAIVDRSAFKDLWGFSSRLTGFNALNYWSRNADGLLIGKFIGVQELAYYNRAYNLMLMPVALVGSVTSRVMFPALSRIQENREQVKRVYLRAVGLIALVTFPAMLGLMVVAEPFIRLVYGPQWGAVVPILQILCIPSLLQCLTGTTGWIFQSQGRTGPLLRLGIVTTATVIAAFFIGLPWGVEGVATAYAIWTAVMFVPIFSFAGRLIGVSAMDVARVVSGVSLASVIMAAAVWLVETRIPDGWGSGAQLVLGIVVGVISYSLVLHLVAPNPYGELKYLLGEYRQRRASVAALPTTMRASTLPEGDETNAPERE